MSEEQKKDKDAAEGGADKENAAKEPPAHHEEAFSETQHSIVVDGETIDYTATAGRIVLKEEHDDAKKASFFFTAYTKDGADPAERPIVFAFNGGPGSSRPILQCSGPAPFHAANASFASPSYST